MLWNILEITIESQKSIANIENVCNVLYALNVLLANQNKVIWFLNLALLGSHETKADQRFIYTNIGYVQNGLLTCE